MPFKILVVCTANICRSPAGERLLQERLLIHGITPVGISVASAGVHAQPGTPACDLSMALVDAALGSSAVTAEASGPPNVVSGEAHRSQRITGEMLTDADLILTADRGHRVDITKLDSSSRNKTFTLRQAARLSTWIVGAGRVLHIATAKATGVPVQLEAGDPLAGVPALPTGALPRLAWFLDELDAARGLAPAGVENPPGWDPDDIADPHTVGYQLHPVAIGEVASSATSLADGIAAVLTTPAPGPSAAHRP